MQTWLMGRKGENLRGKPEAPHVDPSSMMGPMKSQAVFYLSNMGFLFLVQSLFSGFVLVKLPFSLTARFRSVTQRDVAHSLDLLDPALVTSFSWYMMCLYGCQGIITLVLGGKSSDFADQSMMMMSQMGMGMQGGARQQWNATAAFKAEKDQLRIAPAGPTALEASEAAIVEAFKSKADVEEVAARQAAAAAEATKRRLRGA
jgi:ER membrane protein complex subunit 3